MISYYLWADDVGPDGTTAGLRRHALPKSVRSRKSSAKARRVSSSSRMKVNKAARRPDWPNSKTDHQRDLEAEAPRTSGQALGSA
jgi:hypothetical protein